MSGNEEASPHDVMANAQVAITDLRRRIAPFFGGGFGDNKTTAFNKTAFDGFNLNDMVDMVDDSKPSDLEGVGDALAAAATKIDEVGEDLKTHIGNVDWEGEAGTAFRKWGSSLAKNTLKLGSFASGASVQVKAAGLGLAMVKSSMPPREGTGPGPKVAAIPKDERKGNNQDFVKAAKADATKREEIRQEAIIQMNKLSSYYQVSHDTMYAQEEPIFKPLPAGDIGMPPPPPGWVPREYAGSSGAYQTSGPVAGAAAVSANGPGAESGGPGSVPGVTPLQPSPVPGDVSPAASLPAPSADHQVGTEIDSVRQPVAPTTDPGIRPPVPTTSNPGGPPPPTVGPVGYPPMSTPRTGTGLSKNLPTPRPVGPMGRPPVGTPASPGRAGSPPPVGRPPGQGLPMGRPPVGTPASPGRAGSPPPVGRPPGQGLPMGRPPVGAPASPGRAGSPPPVGRPPMGTPASPGRAGSPPPVGRPPGQGLPMGRPPMGTPASPGRMGSTPPPVGRPPSIVGGTPSRSGGPGAANAPRLPRGTVIGGEHPPMGRSPMGGMGMGGAGAPNAGMMGGNPGRRLISTPGGVVGTPRTGAPAHAGRHRAFTPGGTGLVRGGGDANSRNAIGMMPRGHTPTGRDPERHESRRPDYLVEDEETWMVGRRRTVPSVVV